METLIKNVNILNPNEEIQTSCNVLIEDKDRQYTIAGYWENPEATSRHTRRNRVG